ncbi:MAG: DNA polymerase III subunit delta [Actinobacteria bacterium]|nr:DNA polymerase III subunit delta [Actinomycetota bacterium]MCL5882771.1 DNA polymerase III subunit delta [Actinomycetota bacterium]
MKKATKKDALAPVYLITGSDETKVEKAMHRLRDRVIRDAGTDLNVDIFDAAVESAAPVVQAACTLPFGEGVRLVMVTNVGSWHKADKDLIVNYLALPSETTCLALVGGGIRKNEILMKSVAEVGQVLSYEAPRPSSMPAWVQEQARERHLKIGSSEARRLATIAGSDQRAILGELEKIATYRGRGEVKMEDIEELCWVSPEVRIWDLTDALGARDRQQVFRHLEELLADRAAPTSVFFSISKHMKNLCVVVTAKERGEDPMGAAAALGLKPFPARKVADQSRNFTAGALQESVKILSELDADMKGRGNLRPDLALELALARIMDII